MIPAVFFPLIQQKYLHEGFSLKNKRMRDEFTMELAPTVRALVASINSTPEIYAQDGKGEEAVIYLHYFTGGADWWITEAEKSGEEAFGLVRFYGCEAELGYISIPELVAQPSVELDFYWEKKTIGEIRAAITRGVV